MAKDKSFEDTISEEEYTRRMSRASTSPEDDSPGDSEADAGEEFLMGLEYIPDKNSDPEETLSEEILEDKVDKKTKLPIKKIAESAKVVSSDQPAPWMDRDSATATH